MTFGRKAAAALALLLAACSNTSELAGGDSYGSAGSGVSDSPNSDGPDDEAGDGDGDGDGDEQGHAGLDLPGGPTTACDPWMQDCPAGEKCSWERVDELAQTRCVPVEADAKLPGEPCTVFGAPDSGYDDCALGAVCSHLDLNNRGVCIALCGGSPASPTCGLADAVCRVCPDCPSLCVPLCNPLAQDCAPEFACVPEANSFACRPSAQVGTAGLGESCEYTIQCEPGNACLDAPNVPGCAGSGCCSPFCSVTDPSCPQGMICAPWFAGDTPPLADLGVCKIQ